MSPLNTDFKFKKILIVDDDLYLAKILRSILETFEVAQVRMAKSYDEAITIINNHPFDCIFVDNMMSDKNGLMLAKHIRQSKDINLQKIPMILCTSFTGLQSILDARDAGITEILAKPISPEQIMEKISNALFKQRPFIVSDSYYGPDRRRRIRDYDGSADRRNNSIPLPEKNEMVIDDKKEDE